MLLSPVTPLSSKTALIRCPKPFSGASPLRLVGPFIILLIVLLVGGERYLSHAHSLRLRANENRAYLTCAAIHSASLSQWNANQPHPGFPQLRLPAPSTLVILQGTGNPEQTYAQDDLYLYGISTRQTRSENTGEVLHDYILRAWPLEFGVTGDVEYLFQDGRFWAGANTIGRSGTRVGFPPPFPAPDVDQLDSAWWPVPLPSNSGS